MTSAVRRCARDYGTKAGSCSSCCWPRSWNAASHGSTWVSRCR
nr:MAG TPA: hypothetical protein [Caudoviricetes sp.]